MPATEPIQGGPYPEPSDAPDGPNQMAALVVWAAGRLVMRFASPAARDAAITSPVEDMIAITGTGATQVLWLRGAASWREVLSNPAWIAPTLINSWVNFGGAYQVAGYRKTINGDVELRGVVKSGSGVIFTLPVGYRPPAADLQIVAAGTGFVHVNWTADGNVFISNYGSGGSNINVSLTDIHFSTLA